jgi:hypothetical protein
MYVSSDEGVGMQRYFYRHTYNNNNIPICRYTIPTLKVSFQEIPTAVCVTILLYLVQNTCSYLHGRYIFRNTYGCMCHYPAVFLQEIPSHTAPFSAPFSAQVSVPVSAHRHMRGRIAVASLLHRRRIAVTSPDSIAAALRRWRVADLIGITRCSRIEEVEPY